MSDDDQVRSHDAAPRAEPTRRARIPPPAFPPGSRRVGVRRALERNQAETVATLPDDVPFISPDEPIPHREPLEPRDAVDPSDVVVTGIGGDPHLDGALDPGALSFGGDPHVFGLLREVDKLAEALRHQGEAGLHVTPEMSRFEATLRAYCVGYLTGRRTEDEEKR